MAISRMKNGTWRLEIYRPDAPRIRKVFKTRQEARKYETIFKGEIEKGNHDILDTFNKVLKGEISREEPVANKNIQPRNAAVAKPTESNTSAIKLAWAIGSIPDARGREHFRGCERSAFRSSKSFVI